MSDNNKSGLTEDQLKTFLTEIFSPICPYTEEFLKVKQWGDTYYLHDYYSSRKWQNIDSYQTDLSKAVYRFKKQPVNELLFEYRWGLLRLCSSIPEKTIYLYRVPSSDDTLQEKNNYFTEHVKTPIDLIISTMASEQKRTLLSLLKEFYCKDKTFVDCHDHIFRKYPIVPNHERPKKKMAKATFGEQLDSMAVQGYLSHFDKKGEREQIACLVLDDIVTSGASMSAACKTIRMHANRCQQPVSIYSFALACTVIKNANPPSVNPLSFEELVMRDNEEESGK